MNNFCNRQLICTVILWIINVYYWVFIILLLINYLYELLILVKIYFYYDKFNFYYKSHEFHNFYSHAMYLLKNWNKNISIIVLDILK